MRTVLVVSIAVLLCACGGAPPPAPASAPAAAPEPATAPPAPVASPSLPAASAEATAASAGPTAAPPAAEAPKQDDTRPARDKIYRTTPHGLEIELAGVLLVANAKAVRVGKGWGADVTVVASSTDKESHVLANPEHGPLAFAAKVDRGGTEEKAGDKRSGDATLDVGPGAKRTLKRRWPPSDVKPALAGQSAALEVGLWGLGKDAASLYPVRELFTIKLAVAPDNKATALVTPPASAAEE